METLKLIDKIGKREVNLREVYKGIAGLSAKYPRNHNLEAKIRQQLQILRNKDFIEFLGNGQYRLI